MSPTTKVVLACAGIFLGGITGYYEVHSGPGDVVVTSKFWIGLVMAGLAPLASYFIGLSQKAPWETGAPASAPSGAAKVGVLIALGLLLGACATGGVDLQLPDREEPKSLAEALANLKADAVLDLDAALVIANAHGDVIAAACWPALKQFFTEQTGTGTPTVDQVKGVFSAWEKARVERIALEGKAGTGVKLPDYLKLGCAALVQDERLFALRLAALIAGASAGVPGVGGLLPK